MVGPSFLRFGFGRALPRFWWGPLSLSRFWWGHTRVWRHGNRVWWGQTHIRWGHIRSVLSQAPPLLVGSRHTLGEATPVFGRVKGPTRCAAHTWNFGKLYLLECEAAKFVDISLYLREGVVRVRPRLPTPPQHTLTCCAPHAYSLTSTHSNGFCVT